MLLYCRLIIHIRERGSRGNAVAAVTESRRARGMRNRLRRMLAGACCIVAVLYGGVSSAYAATRGWVGSAGGNTNDTNNWAASDPASCTGGGSSFSGSSDDIIFDPDCDNNATIHANLRGKSTTMESDYSGTVTQNTGVSLA